MSLKGVDNAFRVVGDKPGLEIWCIVNLHLVPIPKSSHGKFYSGNAYVLLSTVVLKNGLRQHNIHYWLGKNARKVDCTMTSEKAVELDAALGSHTVQYREVEGSETERFVSYFRPCIIPLEGSFTSQMQRFGDKSYRILMYSCTGDHVPRVREVPFSRSSLNRNEVFILDTQSKIFLFCGRNSSIQSRAKALDVVQYIIENQHGGRCEVTTVEDGKLIDESGEFWSLFGGYAPIPRDPPQMSPNEAKTSSPKLFLINKGKLLRIDTRLLDKALLDPDKCYMLDCNAETFVWMGRTTLVSVRKESVSAIEGYVHSQGRSASTRTIFISEGHETAKFKSYFNGWPRYRAPSLYEEGRGKVAAIFKHQGYNVAELPEDEPQPSISCNGSLKVWLVDRHRTSLLPSAKQDKLYTGDCYIVQYDHPGTERDYHLFYAWLGQKSVSEDRIDAVSIMSGMVDSVKGRPIMAQVFEGKEPDMFLMIFKALVIFKGGMSTAYKKFMLQKENLDETHKNKRAALFRIQGSGSNSVQAIEVDLVSTSLNSSYGYILQDGDSFFTWVGSFSSPSDYELVDIMLDRLSPLKQSILVREGSESDDFWKTLGGKAEYQKEKHISYCSEDPRLFSCVFEQGVFEAKEIFNFTQEDLTTEDALILDCGSEIFVWIGLHADVTSMEEAFNLEVP